MTSDPLVNFLRRRGAWAYPHALGRTLLQHLIATRDILAEWGQPEWLQHAGLFHSIYSTQAYRLALVDASKERAAIQVLLGERAEHIVDLFCRVDRRDLRSALLRRTTPSLVPRELTVRGWRGDDTHVLQPWEVDALIRLHLANEADQACTPSGCPALWLAGASRLANRLDSTDLPALPIFLQGTECLGAAEERMAREEYLIACSFAPGDESAIDLLHRAHRRNGHVGEPLVLLSLHARHRGDRQHGERYAEAARHLLDVWGTAWDKRLSVDQWRALADGDEAVLRSALPVLNG